jgi:LacI family transcriptional regulator
VARYEAAGTPVITLFDAGPAFARLPLLTPSFSDSSAAVAEHLKGLGHRRAGLLLDKARSRPLVAILDALKAAGIGVDVIEPTEAGGMSAVIAAMGRQSDAPTALIALEPKARGLLAACGAAGIDVPGDLSLISVGEIGAERRRGRGVTALIVDPHRMGRAASASMLAWLAGSRPVGRAFVQAGAFEIRATTGPAPGMAGASAGVTGGLVHAR